MASRQFTEFSYSLEKYPVTLFANVLFGATGAPTLQYWNASQFAPGSAALATAGASGFKGIKSVTRTSAGLFVFTLQDTYVRLLFVEAVFLYTSIPVAPVVALKAQAVNTVAAPTITLWTLNGSLAATDPASGEAGLFRFTLSNASEV